MSTNEPARFALSVFGCIYRRNKALSVSNVNDGFYGKVEQPAGPGSLSWQAYVVRSLTALMQMDIQFLVKTCRR